MRRHIKAEVAIEIISMYIAMNLKYKNTKKANALILERKQIYLGNEDMMDKALTIYSKNLLQLMEDENGINFI